MPNVIEILVTGRNLTKPAFDEAARNGRAIGLQVGTEFVGGIGEQLDKDLPPVVEDSFKKTKEPARKSGSDAGAAFTQGLGGVLSDRVAQIAGDGGYHAGDSFTAKFSERAKAGITSGALAGILGPGLEDLAKTQGDKAGFDFTTAMGGRLRQQLPADVEKPLEDSGKKGGQKAGQAAAGGISPLIIAGFAAAATAGPGLILTATAGAVLGAGALITKGNASLQSSYRQLGEDASTAITQATAPLIPALTASVKILDEGIGETGSELRSVFAAVAPQAQDFTRGLLSLADNALPGIATGLRAIAPYSGQIAADFGKLGSGIGGLFSGLAGGAGGGMQGFNALIDLASHLLTDVGQLAGALSSGLGPALHDIETVAVPVAGALTDVVKAVPPGLIRAAADATALLFAAFQVGKLAGVVAEGATFVTFLKEATTAEGAMTLATGTATAATTALGAAVDVAIGPLGVLAVAYTAAAEASDLFSGKSSKGGLAGVVEKEQAARTAVKAHSDAVTAAVVAQDAFTSSLLAATGAAGTSAQQSAAATLAALGLTDGTSNATTALYNQLQAFTGTSAAASAYGTVLNADFGKYQSYSDAVAAFTLSLKDQGKALTAGKSAIDLSTDAGAKNEQILSGMAKQNYQVAEALLTQTGNQAQANKALQAGAVQIDAVAKNAGFTKGQIDALNLALYGTKNIGEIKVPISADTGPARQAVAHLLNDINASYGTVQVYASSGFAGGKALGAYAHGGIAGGHASFAASGGPRSGFTWVGEHGPELIPLPAGTRVHSNPDSMRMAAEAAGGGGQTIRLEFVGGASDPLWELLRQHIRVTGGNGPNSVQLVLGQR